MIQPPLAQKVIRLRIEERLTYRAIADKLKLSLRRVHTIATNGGAPARSAREASRVANDRALRALELRRLGLSYAAIARRLGYENKNTRWYVRRLVRQGERVEARRRAAGLI